jgi:hypothetical protein
LQSKIIAKFINTMFKIRNQYHHTKKTKEIWRIKQGTMERTMSCAVRKRKSWRASWQRFIVERFGWVPPHCTRRSDRGRSCTSSSSFRLTGRTIIILFWHVATVHRWYIERRKERYGNLPVGDGCGFYRADFDGSRSMHLQTTLPPL